MRVKSRWISEWDSQSLTRISVCVLPHSLTHSLTDCCAKLLHNYYPLFMMRGHLIKHNPVRKHRRYQDSYIKSIIACSHKLRSDPPTYTHTHRHRGGTFLIELCSAPFPGLVVVVATHDEILLNVDDGRNKKTYTVLKYMTKWWRFRCGLVWSDDWHGSEIKYDAVLLVYYAGMLWE